MSTYSGAKFFDNGDGTFTPVVHLDNGAASPVDWQAVPVAEIAQKATP